MLSYLDPGPCPPIRVSVSKFRLQERVHFTQIHLLSSKYDTRRLLHWVLHKFVQKQNSINQIYYQNKSRINQVYEILQFLTFIRNQLLLNKILQKAFQVYGEYCKSYTRIYIIYHNLSEAERAPSVILLILLSK